VDIAGKNTLQIKAIGVTISTFETLPDRCIWLARFWSETVRRRSATCPCGTPYITL
jgi:hypothetical protein